MLKNNLLLKVDHVNVCYGIHRVLDNISFNIQSGDYIGLVGPNGAGKSTLVKALLGIVELERGEILYQDGARVSYLPQSASAGVKFPAKVYEVVETGLITQKGSRKEKREKVNVALERFGLIGLRNQLIGELSGGQLQRVLLARTIVNQASMIFLDEPTSALDPKIRDDFYRLLQELNSEGMTILLVSHDHQAICTHAKTIMDLDKTIQYFGSPTEYRGGGHHL